MKKGKKLGLTILLVVFALAGIVVLMTKMKQAVREPEQDPTYEREMQQAYREDMDRFATDVSEDFLTEHQLPRLEMMSVQEEEEYVNSLQVMEKIRVLEIPVEELLAPRQMMYESAQSLDSQRDTINSITKTIDFHGTTSQELQQLMDSYDEICIHIKSGEIIVTDTIRLHNNVVLMGNGVHLKSALPRGQEDTGQVAVQDAGQDTVQDSQSPFNMIMLVEGCANVQLQGFCMDGGGDAGIFVKNSRNVVLDNNSISHMNSKAIVVDGQCEYITVEACDITQNGQGGIYFCGDVSGGILKDNRVYDNYGTSNWMAGIVLTGVGHEDAYNIWEKFGEKYHFPQEGAVRDRRPYPSHIILNNNQVQDNNASGIYGDGFYESYVVGNQIHGNDKEGMCLDNGTLGIYVADNQIHDNGYRVRQSDQDLILDEVYEAGRMEDGSAVSKLPGLSLDNTAYNIISNNMVGNNYGGGIKMVRSAAKNVVIGNQIVDNNIGASGRFHYFGIELGSAEGFIDSLDFTPDYENLITGNTILGNHYSGIFLGEGAYYNRLWDNEISGTKMFRIENVSGRKNTIL